MTWQLAEVMQAGARDVLCRGAHVPLPLVGWPAGPGRGRDREQSHASQPLASE